MTDQLVDPKGLQFSPLNMVVEAVPGHGDWKKEFTARYLDFTPVQDQLWPGDPRRHG